MKPTISIIIPVYNVEKYLSKCLDSCINQTFKDIEVILVNDCSPDNSDLIMKEYQTRYPEIIRCIYLEKNIKQGGARNKGIEIARGDYILFVDSDDYIAEDMCEKMYKSASSNGADIVICDYFRVSNKNQIIRSQLNIKIENIDNISVEFLLKHRVNQGIFCKLYNKDLFSTQKFPENVYHEDLAVTLIWILSAKKINYISIPLYYYVYRSDSVMCKTDYFTKLQYASAIMCLIENLKKSNLYYKYYESLCTHIMKEVIDFICIYIMQFLEYGFKDLQDLIKSITLNIPDWSKILDIEEVFLECEKNIIHNCFSNDNYMEMLNRKNETEIVKMFNENKVAIWGWGLYGKNLLQYLSKYKLKPEYIIDSNCNLHGTWFDKILIDSFTVIKDKCDVIIVAIKDKNTYENIREIVNKADLEIKVVYFEELFEI